MSILNSVRYTAIHIALLTHKQLGDFKEYEICCPDLHLAHSRITSLISHALGHLTSRNSNTESLNRPSPPSWPSIRTRSQASRNTATTWFSSSSHSLVLVSRQELFYSRPYQLYCISRLSTPAPFSLTSHNPFSPTLSHYRKITALPFTDSPVLRRSFIPPLAAHKRPHKIYPPPPLLSSYTPLFPLLQPPPRRCPFRLRLPNPSFPPPRPARFRNTTAFVIHRLHSRPHPPPGNRRRRRAASVGKHRRSTFGVDERLAAEYGPSSGFSWRGRRG